MQIQGLWALLVQSVIKRDSHPVPLCGRTRALMHTMFGHMQQATSVVNASRQCCSKALPLALMWSFKRCLSIACPQM